MVCSQSLKPFWEKELTKLKGKKWSQCIILRTINDTKR